MDMAMTGIFIWGPAIANEIWGPSTREAEAVCRHPLQILTAETTKS